MRVLITCLLLLCLFISCNDDDIPYGNELDILFPLQKGNTWSYDFQEDFIGDTTFTNTSKVDTVVYYKGAEYTHIKNMIYAIIYSPFIQPGIGPYYYGSYQVSGNKLVALYPGFPGFGNLWKIVALDLPLDVGKKWISYQLDRVDTFQYGYQHHTAKNIRYVRGIDTVKVPRGTYEAYHIEDSSYYFIWGVDSFGVHWDSTVTVTNEWYSEFIGLIKQTATGIKKNSDGLLMRNSRVKLLRHYSLMNIK